MNAVIGLSHLLLKTELTPRQRDYIGKVHSAGQHLLGVINDILDFSKVEAGKLELELAQFDIEKLLDNTTSMIADGVAQKGLELVIDIDPSVPRALRGDPLRLGQILLNFANNAVKFTEKGEIAISVAPLARARGRGGAEIRSARHRHRPGRRPGRAPVHLLLAGRLVHHAQVRRHRAGPGDQQEAGRADARRRGRGKHARARQHVLVHGPPGHRAGAPAHRAARPARLPRAGGGRQLRRARRHRRHAAEPDLRSGRGQERLRGRGRGARGRRARATRTTSSTWTGACRA